MDPADQEPRSAPVQQAVTQQAVTQQGILLGQHDANIRALISANQTLAQQVASLSAQLASLQAPAAPTDQRNQPETGDDQQRDLQAVPPEPFSGVSSQCKGFIFQCKLFFQLKSISFSNDFSKIHFMLGLLQGKALTWAEARFAGRTFSRTSPSPAFLEEFRRVFESPATPFCASSRLFTITQDRRSVADYTLEFRTLAAEVDWTEDALCAAFYNGLRSPDVSAVPLQFPLRFLIPLGDRLQILQVVLLNLRVFRPLRNPCRWEGLISPQRNGIAGSERVSVFTVGELVTPCLPVPGDQKTGPASKHGNSGGPGPKSQGVSNFVSKFQPPSASSFNGSPFQALIDSGAGRRRILLTSRQQSRLAFPRSRWRDPHQRPRSGRPNPGSGEAPTPHSPLIEPVDLSGVPPAYHDLQEVFNKDKALSLPPHRPYDCAIELLPDAPLPSSRLYNLTRPEQEAMEGYINDSMAAGIIRPSTSPVGAGFFFVKKKDSSLRPCIDFRGLNNITVKNKYPLPLIDSAFTPLQGATIFTKLDLRNAYHLVRIREGDEWKTAFNTPLGHFEYLVMPFGLTNAPAVNLPDHQLHVRQVLQRLLENRLFVKKEKCEFHASQVDFLGFIIKEGCVQADPAKVRAVAEWPIPTNRKLLQRFLGFANFYRRFIRNYSQEAAPLTALTSPSRPFVWSEEAEKAFNRLRTLFTTAPVLVQPDPAQQFVVEVDASDIGVGAVLSQRRGSDGRLHPCAFFSRRLSPAEANYDVGNRELLAVKMALEEWRHWLEGSTQPFVVWTDHKNLAYIQAAKRLNSRQARWALFFSRFDFVLTYRPGSLQHQARRPLKTVQRGGEGAGGGEHPSYLQGHRCYHLGHRERRPAGSTAAARPRAGTSGPLVCPWTLSGHKFCNGLTRPSSHVTQASTPTLLPLAKLPTARETADLLANHVVRLHGIPRDIVSDRGPQFISQVWKSFCTGLGASVSLTSGFHPQSNGQTERTNQDLESALRCVTAGNQSTWCTYLPWVELARHNSLVSSATGVSPFEASLAGLPTTTVSTPGTRVGRSLHPTSSPTV
ncbi:hypothetical protein L3Q82_023114 [Scortum barcoo]|uniref:Uncharacterized protein n=1 Tax=Scortum barcoo TaxID=214431 RepID=A0ACB8X113_9TELE|nr:hypothetical protein L3Q82_023114 [Scortum barcoo]